MTITLTEPGRTETFPAFMAEAEPRLDVVSPEFACATDRVEYDPDPVVVAVQRQADAARAIGALVGDAVSRDADPQAWLFTQRARYVREGTCDPYAQLMLMRAGLLPQR